MSLSEYFLTVVGVSALVAVFELFSYSGGEDAGERLAVSAIMICLIAAPVIPLAESLHELDFSEIFEGGGEAFEDGAYIEVGEEAFKEGVAKLLKEKWGLDGDESVVTVVGFDFDTMSAERIIITLLSKGASVDFHEIEAYIEEAGLGMCEVKYAI